MTTAIVLFFCFIFVFVGIAMILGDQMRKRRGEPRSHEVWEAQRKERIAAERALIEKHKKQ